MLIPEGVALEQYVYLTTTGRKTGRPREIEIWFAAREDRLYLLAGSGNRAHWVRNIERTPRVTVRIGGRSFHATGRIVSDAEEDADARRLLLEKYAPGYSGDLTGWGRTALPVALDVTAASD